MVLNLSPELWIPLLVLIILIAIGVNVAYSMTIAGVLGILFFTDIGGAIVFVVNSFNDNISSFSLSTIPLFVLMAMLLSNSGMVEDIYVMMNNWIGHYTGGLATATIIANGGFAALSGSSSAAAATMGKIAVPQLQKFGYGERISLGTVTAAGTFAIMLPPSVALILYGIFTGTNIGELFIAGIIPGTLTLLGYILVVRVWGFYNPDMIGTKEEKASMDDRLNSLKQTWPVPIIIAAVLGGIYGGFITPTEAGAIGAFASLIVAVLIYRMGRPGFVESLNETTRTTAMIFMLIIGGVIFGRWVAFARLPSLIFGTIGSLPTWQIVLLVLAIYVLLGTFMDQLAILVVTLPITYPLFVDALGYSPVWLGIIIIKTVEIGLVTPPIGLNVFIVTSAIDAPADQAFRGAVPFLIIDIIVLLLMVQFPQIVLWLPSLAG